MINPTVSDLVLKQQVGFPQNKKMPNICCFQFLKCDSLQLYFIYLFKKVNIFLDFWTRCSD